MFSHYYTEENMFRFFILFFVGSMNSDDATKIGSRIIVSSQVPSHYYSLSSVRPDQAGCDHRFNTTTVEEEEAATVSRIRRFFEIQSQIRTLENVDVSIDERASKAKIWFFLEENRVRPPIEVFSAQLWQDWSADADSSPPDAASISPTTCS